MNVVVTGAAGFLGSRVADYLLSEKSPIKVAKLVLIDSITPQTRDDKPVSTFALDLTDPAAAEKVITPETNIVFHLAAVVTGHAEEDFDYGLKVNFDVTRVLVERARHVSPKIRFIFTSSLGVYGGDMPEVLDDRTATTPQNSYGAAKAMSELLLNDYGRRGFVDTRVVRLPTVSVRAGAPNRAVTSFVSGIIREPLNGQEAICPVDENLESWITSPYAVVRNIVHGGALPNDVLETWRVVNLPGICVSVRDMLIALRKIAGDDVANLVRFERDDFINNIVSSLPTRFDNARALKMGFEVDESIESIIRMYIKNELPRTYSR
ncbi:D-erythronate dehydrogenase-like [Leptidea sinapis]|uniref:D-erythronate dehydrogenase-like n=1 Tax=Leptidea sinapis TaxID=189913 RepID=UPI0021C44BFD|nr:D-erythronate dehydrogenase-like [Leptidea sinapis]